MKKTFALFLFSLTFGLYGQMDLLPQMFRALPVEWSEGLPDGMSFKEYRQAMRNVDFMTMGMSMMIPGYGFFQVERPIEGTAIAIFRGVGMGMMGFAMFDQWAHLNDIWNVQNLDGEDLNRVTTNGLLMMGGMAIQFVGWGIDTIGAYHIAKAQKDWVFYKYGVGWAGGWEDPQLFRQNIHRIMNQQDPKLKEEVQQSWAQFASRYYDAPGIGEALNFLAQEAFYKGSFVEAFFLSLRGSVYAQENDWKERNLELAHRAMYLMRLMKEDKDLINSMLRTVAHKDFSLDMANSLLWQSSQLEDPDLVLGLLGEIRYFLQRFPQYTQRLDWYPRIADLWDKAGYPEEGERIRSLMADVYGVQ